MIVVSSRGRHGTGRVLLGSFAESLLLHSRLPVLFLTHSQRAPRKGHDPGKVLFPTDLSDFSRKAFDLFLDQAKALGSEIMVHFTVDAKQAVTEHVLELAEDVDEAAVQNLQERPAETTMIGRFGARSRVQEGDTIDVAVDTRNLHFFDPETGSGIYDDTNEKGAS